MAIIGKDVVVYPQLISAFREIPGIVDIRVRLDDAAVSNAAGAAALDDNLAVAVNEISRWDAARVSVNVL